MTEPVTVMSFDIGIKNMAYCIISVDTDVKILDWCVIDISKKNDQEGEVAVKVCGCTNKTTVCRKKAKYVKNCVFYCEKHARDSTEFLVPEKRLTSAKLKKNKLLELEKIIEEFSIPEPEQASIRDKKMNKKEILERIDFFFEKKLLQKVEDIISVKTQHINLIELGRNMAKILDNSRGLNNVTHIIIENQISTLANRMKTIQGMLAQYFIMRFGDKIHIEFVSSANKLKCFPKDKNAEIVNNYKKHKTDAVYYTKEILTKNLSINARVKQYAESTTSETWTDSLVSKKKDDLCDSFLQGIWYLTKLDCLNLDESYQISKK
jgi:hypothetical protein